MLVRDPIHPIINSQSSPITLTGYKALPLDAFTTLWAPLDLQPAILPTCLVSKLPAHSRSTGNLEAASHKEDEKAAFHDILMTGVTERRQKNE